MHALKNPLFTLGNGFQIMKRIQSSRSLWQGGQKSAFRRRQVLQRLVKVTIGSLRTAGDEIAIAHPVEVSIEDLWLAPDHLQMASGKKFNDLRPQRAAGLVPTDFNKLLGNG